MTTAAIRKKLISYIAEADDKKVKGMYLLFEEEIEKGEGFTLSAEHLAILEGESKKHRAGISKSYSRKEALAMVRSKKAS